ncbi:circadian clock KaiB family protein [Thiorhodovibrio winogradskyi]|uniref:circadian clock KaiB family protein n=1 Tax=Thiorhodovibrio winogradskyi TaxID=77007 RepID=UPI003D32D9CD
MHSGDCDATARARQNVQAFCQRVLGDDYKLELVNILLDPTNARQLGILVTPTLIKSSPAPETRMIGDFSDENRLRQCLGLTN